MLFREMTRQQTLYEYKCKQHGRYRKYTGLLGWKTIQIEFIFCLLVIPLTLILYYARVINHPKYSIRSHSLTYLSYFVVVFVTCTCAYGIFR